MGSLKFEASGFLVSFAFVLSSAFILFSSPPTFTSVYVASIVYVFGGLFPILYAMMTMSPVHKNQASAMLDGVAKGSVWGYLGGSLAYGSAGLIAFATSSQGQALSYLVPAFASISFGTAFIMYSLQAPRHAEEILRNDQYAPQRDARVLKQAPGQFFVSLFSGKPGLAWRVRLSDLMIFFFIIYLAGWILLARYFSYILIIPGVLYLGALLAASGMAYHSVLSRQKRDLVVDKIAGTIGPKSALSTLGSLIFLAGFTLLFVWAILSS